MARVADGLGVAWNTAAVLAEGQRVLISDPTRFDGAKVVGVDEHVWRHTRRGDRYVTVIIDLTLIRGRTGPSRLVTEEFKADAVQLVVVGGQPIAQVARKLEINESSLGTG